MTDAAPFTPDQIDELLSARLDDEFDAAAADLGLTPDEARSRLDLTPGVGERATALVAARDALHEPAAIDELLAARLRAKAVRVAAETNDELTRRRARKSRTLLYAVSGIAAAVVGALALGATIQGSHDAKTSAPAAAPRTKTATDNRGAVDAPASATTANQVADGAERSVANYGSYSSAATLANRLASERLPAHGWAYAAQKGAMPQPAEVAPVFAPGTHQSGGSPTTPSSGARSVDAARPADPCTAVERLIAGSTTPALYGVATVAGRPVLLRVFTRGRGSLVLVLTPTCRVVQTLQR